MSVLHTIAYNTALFERSVFQKHGPLAVLLTFSLILHWWFLQTQEFHQPAIRGGGYHAPKAVSLSFVQSIQSQAKAQPEQTTAESPVKPQQNQTSPTGNIPTVKKTDSIESETSKAQPINKVESEKKPVEKVQEKNTADVSDKEQQETADSITAQKTSISEAANNQPSAIPTTTDAKFRATPTPPNYPKLALRRRQEGEALVRALVGPDGDTEKVELVRSSGYSMLDKSALKAVKKWQFAAAMVAGQPTRSWIEVPVLFEIR